MSQYVQTPTKAFPTNGALGQYLRVKLAAGFLALAGAGDIDIGVTESAVFATGIPSLVPLAVRLSTAQGTSKMVANGAIASGAACYAAANGQIAASGSQLLGLVVDPIGATAAGDVVEVMRVGAGAISSAVGGTTATAFNINSGGAAAQIVISTNSATGAFTNTWVTPNLTGNITVTFPAVTSTLATLAGTENLTNKTLTSPIFVTPAMGVATGTSLAVTAGLTSSGPTGAGVGYASGAGGSVVQATNRTTGVTLSKLSGQITTASSSLAVETAASFTVTNSTVAIGDVVVVSQQSGANGGDTAVYVSAVAAGSFNITVANNNAAGGTVETGAIIINYAVIKAVSS